MNCPHCLLPTKKYNYDYLDDDYNEESLRCTYVCENEVCKEQLYSTLYNSKWMIGFDDLGNVVFYTVCISHNNKNYFIDADIYNGTSLYYDLPNFGSLMQPPILELPRMLLLKEPYLECIQQHLDKFLTLLPFI